MSGPIIVATFAELQDALVPANAGTTIKMAAGLYEVSQPSVLPDGVTLKGEGDMTFSDHLPDGIAPGSRTVLRAAATLQGDILTLGNGTRISGLVIEDLATRSTGNLVVISSTKPQDNVTATIDSCELFNPRQSDANPSGPIGRGLLVITRNPIGANLPAPHEGATVAVTMERSFVRSPANGSGVFVINFAPRARVMVRLARNIIGGGLDANGGVSRPFPVTGSELFILSNRNLYRSDGAPAAAVGWLLHGGSNPPIPFFKPPSTSNNALVMDSKKDRIEGFDVGIHAGGGWRPFGSPVPGDGPGPVSQCRAELRLDDTIIASAVTDMILIGAESGGTDFTPGDDNRVRVSMQGVTGSGSRANRYDNAAVFNGATLPVLLAGSGNRLEIIEEFSTFTTQNVGIEPPPAPEFFL